MPLDPGSSEKVIGHNIHEMEKAGHPHKQAVAAALHKAYDEAHAAGVLLTHGDRALFLKRSGDVKAHPGEWCCPGGSIEGGETPEQAAHREMQEETGLAGLLTGDFNRIDEGDGFVTFHQEVESEPAPTLNEEHTEAMWAPLSDPPQPLHPGVAATLKKLSGEAAEVEDAAWSESDHPRSEEGKFSTTPGGKTEYAGKPSVNPYTDLKNAKVARAQAWEHANFLKARGHEDVKVTKKLHNFTVPGQGISSSTTYYTHHGQSKKSGDALDRREWDTNGWFEVLDNPLSTVGVYPYRESSVIQGGDRNKMVNVYRSAEELSDPEAVKSFKLMPWTDDHPDALLGDESQQLVPAEQKGVHGVIGEQTYYRDGTLYGNIKVFSEQLARKIAAGKRELSCGYRCDFVPQEGVYDGTPYQYVQKNLRGNHVASVKSGRMGSGVRVLDAADVPFEYFTFALDLKETAMAADEWSDEARAKAAEARKKGSGGVTEGQISKLRQLKKAWKDHPSEETKQDYLSQKAAMGGDAVEDAMDAVVEEFMDSQEYATKVAGKVAAEKGMTGHDSIGNLNEDKTMPKAATDGEAKNPTEKGDSPGEKGDLAGGSKTKDSMTEEEEAGMDAKEEAKDAEEEKADKEKDDKEARDRKSARDRRGGARDARKSARDKAKDARDKAAKDEAEKKAAADAKGKGMDAAEVTALVQKEVTAATADLSKTIRKEEAAKLSLYGRVSPLIGAFDHAEMSHVDMATYSLKKLGVTAAAADPVTALDFYLTGRNQAAVPLRSAHDSATGGESFVDKYLAA